jgi:DNA-directed RNA polymerase specialized sigma24 family protein
LIDWRPRRRERSDGPNLDDVVAALPEARRARVEARAQELKEQVESLSELRRVAGKAQVEIASALNVKQPSVSKIEKQADMYLSTLRSYVEAVGGQPRSDRAVAFEGSAADRAFG